jgi:hypothetical protein
MLEVYSGARMPKLSGRNVALSLPRRFIIDLVHFARKVPSVPVQRRMNLAAVVAARQAAAPRPSWAAIFTKAYAFVCAARPELRRAYLPYPWPHLYEHPIPIVSVAVERQFEEEEAVFFGHVRSPEQRGLAELDGELRRFKESDLNRVGSFRQALRMSRLPRPLRRFAWWVALNWWGRKRAHYFGTFGLSVYAGLGAASLHPLSPVTTLLNYGMIDEQGWVDVRIIYDHRVMDGGNVARALADLERVLNNEIVTELRYLKCLDAA